MSAQTDAQTNVPNDPLELPSWLAEPEDYEPARERSTYLARNVLSLGALLARVKAQRGGLVPDAELGPLDRQLARVAPAARLAGVLVLVALNAAATNMLYVYLTAALVLTELALKPTDDLLDVLKPALGAALVASVVMLPAAFLGQPASGVRIGVKTFCSVALLACLARAYAWNRIVAALRAFRLPHVVVFVIDITLKHIVLLGEVMSRLLDALTLRSVGASAHREQTASASGVLGTTFLKSTDAARRMSEAMACRGFAGEYVVALDAETRMTKQTIAYFAGLTLMVAAFVWLGMA